MRSLELFDHLLIDHDLSFEALMARLNAFRKAVGGVGTFR